MQHSGSTSTLPREQSTPAAMPGDEGVRIHLAPLRGFTDSIFRNTFARHFSGVDAALAPFIPSVGTPRFRIRHFRDVLPEQNRLMPITPQVLGNSAADFITTANHLYELGYETVNWNLGCPFPMVARKKRGAGLLPHPDRIDAFLAEATPALKGRLSIKTRLGWEHSREIMDLIPVFNRYPLAELIVHPRTGVQRYDGRPDIESFGRCLALSVHPVTFNGDIVGLSVYNRMRRLFPGVVCWMIGRGIVANPFLPSMIRRPDAPPENPLDRFRRFHDDLFDGYDGSFSGPTHVVDKMKGFWTYFGRSFNQGGDMVKNIHKARRKDRYLRTVETFFAGSPRWSPSG